tara:strand:- start:82 stop:747 length:666 start_codon:yes stop_codon:yes gene_type:complete
MAPIIQVSDETLGVLNPSSYTRREDLEKSTLDLERDFVYVPSTGLYISKERILQGKNWFEVHEELQKQGSRMSTISEFGDFLKYTKSDFPDVYNDVMEVISPWRAEWLDADFKVKEGVLYINSNHVLDLDGNLIPENSEPLDGNTLMEDKRISFDSWLNNPTSQGLPREDVDEEVLYYWNPRNDNNSVAGFDVISSGVYLGCGWDPSHCGSVLGVRAVRHE